MATAKRVSQKQIQPQKLKSEQPLKLILKDQLSLNFSRNMIVSDISSAGSSSSRPANVHRLNNMHFKNPTTPQMLEAVLEIKEGRDVMVEEIPDSDPGQVGDELPTAWVPLTLLINEIYLHIFQDICQ